MKFSEYMIDCAIHRQHTITPQIAVKVQEITNTALDLADRLSYDEYAAKERLYQQTKELEELFHVDTPMDNYKKIVEDINVLVEGADSLWAYLK